MTGEAGRFGAVVTAMVTPFREDHALDLDARAAARVAPVRARLGRARRRGLDRRVADPHAPGEGSSCSGR